MVISVINGPLTVPQMIHQRVNKGIKVPPPACLTLTLKNTFSFGGGVKDFLFPMTQHKIIFSRKEPHQLVYLPVK